MATHLNVPTPEPAKDWAHSTTAALDDASTVKEQQQQFPGAWAEHPSESTTGQAAGQAYEDVSNVLSQVGNAAYNALPQGIKDTFSPPQRALPTDSTTLSQSVSNTAAAAATAAAATAAASTLAAGSSIAYSKANEALSNLTSPSNANPNAPEPPTDTIHTLPSTEKEGTLPASGPMGGVGALPGPSTEEGVALLPEERANPDPLHILGPQTSGARTNELLASPYNTTASPYADVKANIVTQPPSVRDDNNEKAPKNGGSGDISAKAPGVAEKLGVAGATAATRVRAPRQSDSKSAPGTTASRSQLTPPPPPHGADVLSSAPPVSGGASIGGGASFPVPAPASTTPPSSSSSLAESGAHAKREKVSFMDKLKGEVKIFSGKMANDEAKVEAGKALKNGSSGGGKRE